MPRRGFRTAATATVVALALSASAACARHVEGAPVAAAQPLQLRLVTSAEPFGSRTCPSESPAPSTVAELCERTGPMLYRLDPSVTHSAVQSASVSESSGQWLVTFQLDDADSGAVAETTARSVGRQLAMVVGARVVSAPVISAPITGGRIQMSGGFTEQQARDLATTLKPS